MPTKTAMKKKELEEFKKLLLLERQSVLQHLAQLKGDSDNELAQGLGDSVDIASAEVTQAAIQKLGNREKKLLSKIDHALDKFESGNYGVCENCGEPISPARLRARPVAQFCIDCKTEQEQNERRYGPSEEEDDDMLWSGDDDSDQGG